MAGVKGKSGKSPNSRNGFKKGHKAFVTEESRRKMSLARKGKMPKNIDLIINFPRLKGADSPGWKGGVTKMLGYRTFICKRRRARLHNNGGNHTIKEWESLKSSYNFVCPSCFRGEPEIYLTQDHIIPLSRGGMDSIENIQPLCMDCNRKKHNKIIKYDYGIR